MKIPEKLLQKYKTDYIILKIVEGVSTKKDYAEELNYRQIAREELDKIGG